MSIETTIDDFWRTMKRKRFCRIYVGTPPRVNRQRTADYLICRPASSTDLTGNIQELYIHGKGRR